MWLELLQGIVRVVDKSKSGTLATSEVSVETKDGNLVLLGLVELSKLRP